jgi:hypothetical protein
VDCALIADLPCVTFAQEVSGVMLRSKPEIGIACNGRQTMLSYFLQLL